MYEKNRSDFTYLGSAKASGPKILAAVAVAGIAVLVATKAPAQTPDTVILKTFDKSSSVAGELVEVDADFYRIKTIAGILEVAIQSVDCIGAACPHLVPEFVVGQEITLTSKDGSASVTGEILSYNDTEIMIDAGLLGQVVFERSQVICRGPNCALSVPQEPSAASILQSLLSDIEN